LKNLRDKIVDPIGTLAMNQVDDQVNEQVRRRLDIRVWKLTIWFLHRHILSQMRNSL